MGALTSNRKRGIDYSSPSLPLRQPHSVLGADNPFPKKLKFTQSMSNSEVSNPQVSWKSAAVRLHQYPERLNPITRKVHAPVRNSKFGISRVSIGEANNRHHSAEFQAENYAMKYGKYEKSKTEAYGSLMYTLKGKEVIDIDYEEKVQEAVNVDVSEDLSVEEVEIVENGKERWRECDIKSMELDGDIRDRNIQPSCSSVVSEDITIANLKSESAGKVLDKVSTSQDFDIPRVPVHRKLYDSADKHNKKLAELNFQIELATKQLSTVRLYQTAKKPAKDVVTEPFVPLTDDEQNEVAVALSNAKRRKILVTHENSNIEITGELLQCLRPGAWLNDEIINLYLELLKEREKRNPQKFLKCHFFNTFFYKKLIGGRSGYDFKSVKRWTTQRKLGYCLVECDKIFVPVHKETHWCLAVINKKDEKFQYLDSLKGGDKQVMKVLARYFTDEVNDKVGKVIDVNSWKQEFVQDLPEQQNGYDCGVFMIKYADFYSRDVGLCFHQVFRC